MISKEEFLEQLNSKNIKLNNQQVEGILQTEGPVLLLAVPGSGKTTVLVCRTGYMIQHLGVRPERILTVTFSKASSIDMKERFKKFFENEINCNLVNFSTIHSFAYKIVMEYARQKNVQLQLIEENFLYNGQWISKSVILKQLYYKYNEEYITDDSYAELCREIGYIKNRGIKKKDFHTQDFNTEKFEEIYSEYDQIKKNNYWIDFDDMLTYCYAILKKNPNILASVASQYDYIQIDEGQDTSLIQHSIVDIIIPMLKNKNIFLVGDEDQSIYGFRGADPQLLLNFDKKFNNAKVLLMEQNYRSTKEIVELSNNFIKKNTIRHDKNLFTESIVEGEISINYFNDKEDQVKWVVEEIINNEEYSDTAILYRNNISAVPYVNILKEKEIPFFVRDFDTKLLKHWVIQDIYDILDFIEDTSRIDLFEKLYYKFRLFIKKDIVKKLKDLLIVRSKIHKNEEKDVLKVLLDSGYLSIGQEDTVKDLIFAVRRVKKCQTVKEKILLIKKDMNYNEYLKSRYEDSPDGYDNIISILDMIYNLGEGLNNSLDLQVKVEDLVKTIKEMNKKNRFEDVVVLTTRHSSKGLEFENVYLIDLTKERIPEEIITEDDKIKIEEERRNFYVGMTRAKKKLGFCTYLRTSNNSIDTSRFLLEVENILAKKETEN